VLSDGHHEGGTLTDRKLPLRNRLLFLCYDMVLMSIITFIVYIGIKVFSRAWSWPEYIAVGLVIACWSAAVWRFTTGRGTFPYDLFQELMNP
jgi:hypothetical protein